MWNLTRREAAILACALLVLLGTWLVLLHGQTYQPSDSHSDQGTANDNPWERTGVIFAGLAALAATALAVLVAVQIRDGRISSERQLRAYFLFAEGDIRIPKTKDGLTRPWSIQVIFRNFGQTPAFDVRIKYKVQALPTADNNALELPDSEERRFPVIAPSHPYILSHAAALERGQATHRGIRMKGKSIYIWGRIDYLDTFGTRHWTRFQVANACQERLSFHICTEGNYTDDQLSLDA